MSVQFFLIRHGETEWNSQGIYQGQLDSCLTDLGRKQAQALGERLSKYTFDAVYSSDLGRCKETLQYLFAKNALQMKSCVFHPGLRERHLGDFQGLGWKESSEKYPEDFKKFESRELEHRIPGGGESIVDKHQRFMDAFVDIANRHEQQRVLVISHGGAVDSLIRETLNLPLNSSRAYELPNLAWNHFSYVNRSWRLITWADRSHLERLDQNSLAALDV